MMALRSQDKRELLAQMEPAEEFVLVDGYNIIFAWDELKGNRTGQSGRGAARSDEFALQLSGLPGVQPDSGV